MKKTYFLALVGVLGIASLLIFGSADACACEGDSPSASYNGFAGGSQVSGMIKRGGIIIPSDETTSETIYEWAKSNNMISFPWNETSLNGAITRGELAQMLAAYVKNVKDWKTRHRRICDFRDYHDFPSFDEPTQKAVIVVCDYRLMGRGKGPRMGDMLIKKFRPFDAVTFAEIKILVARQARADLGMPKSVSRADILRRLYAHR